MKRLIYSLFAAVLLCGMPAIVSAAPAIEIVDQDLQSPNVSVNQSTLHVSGANGQTLEIYNIAGVKVMSFKVEGADKKYELNLPKGCYIIKVGKVVRKVSIK
ncbi:MAG: T9SS type A sorting domain-containing protein [Prevotella sp.]|jgi:hypothetical protein|nr:T9SS type A sorting domain-containing protein [Prevotella sp.]MCR5152697.1 T9SS type A sorting domain-containing protein [Prevotella sp.]